MATVTITDLERKKKGPIYAINSSKPPRRGNLVIPIDDRKDQIVIPMTWVPIDLVEHADRSKILGSTQFRQSILRGDVTLLSEKEAAGLMSRDGAHEELGRARAFQINSVPSTRDPMEMAASVPQVDLASQVSPPVYTLIETMATNSEIEVLNTLRNMGTMQRNEYKAVYTRAKELGFKKLKAYCKEQKELLKRS